MKIILHISLFALVSIVVSAQQSVSYFPYEVGNKWEWGSSSKDTTIFDEITDTARLADQSVDVYLNNSETPRYNVKSNGNVYQYLGDNTMAIWFDFTVAPGDTFYTTLYSAEYYVTVDSIEGELFGEKTKIRKFQWYSKSGGTKWGEQSVSDKFGIYYRWSFFPPPESELIVGCTIDGIGYGTLVNVSEEPELVNNFQLFQNYPNPFNPSTKINFILPQSGNVSLSVYNTLGEKIKTIIDDFLLKGNHTIEFDGSKLSSGIYFYKIIFGKKTITKKMQLLK
ncbi:MAG: T9SS type A sorting domain-containing protein [Melioribacteraceae bacterium]|nr:MAG: T9SS type A sorting domain-containing protein [Melioribacteraceae bacterium]